MAAQGWRCELLLSIAVVNPTLTIIANALRVAGGLYDGDIFMRSQRTGDGTAAFLGTHDRQWARHARPACRLAGAIKANA
ncbi:hypothetical protein [Mesorhizobium sp. B2-6-4]|uniref:hypothetical protein n=1 Tax=Mesorhizobium sp. B2-6-4 TaxID=2589913 RepID=UPI001FED7A86|nr:hypothetical protein [Mesorhizobium sp. B2-6-4]